jgi:hypothetical protein
LCYFRALASKSHDGNSSKVTIPNHSITTNRRLDQEPPTMGCKLSEFRHPWILNRPSPSKHNLRLSPMTKMQSYNLSASQKKPGDPTIQSNLILSKPHSTATPNRLRGETSHRRERALCRSHVGHSNIHGVRAGAVRLPVDLPEQEVHACSKDREDIELETVRVVCVVIRNSQAELGGTYTSQTRRYAIWVCRTSITQLY